MRRYYYIIYRNEVHFVDPKCHPDGKVRILLCPQADAHFERMNTDKIEFQQFNVRCALRRIKCVVSGTNLSDIIRFIEYKEGVKLRRQLHESEREMRRAQEILGAAKAKYDEFTKQLDNGDYNNYPYERISQVERRIRRSLADARDRFAKARHILCMMLVKCRAITPKEAERRMSATY